jgi:hypothetical protein
MVLMYLRYERSRKPGPKPLPPGEAERRKKARNAAYKRRPEYKIQRVKWDLMRAAREAHNLVCMESVS